MATLSISLVSECAGRGHFTLHFTLGAQSIDIDMDANDLNQEFTPDERRETLKRFMAIIASQYTAAQLRSKLQAGISVTL